MSRSVTSKVKGLERDRKSTLPTTTPVAHDIIAGKFTDQDWLWMLDRDDSGSFVIDLVNDIYSAADKIIYDKYIEDQLIPYTVLQVKDALLQIVEWQFLARDEDSSSTASMFQIQDDEPRTAITDCWAQGAVPLTFRSPAPITEETEHPGSPRKLQSPRCTDKVGVDAKVCSPRSDLEAVATNICSPVIFEQNDGCATESAAVCHSVAQSPICEEVPFKMPESPVFACDNIAKQTTTEKRLSVKKAPVEKQPPTVTKSESSVTNGVCDEVRAVKCEDITIDAYITKIPPSRLPSNRVNTVYCIIDPKQEAAKVRSEALRARKKMPHGEKPVAQKTSSTGHNLSVAKVKVAETDGVTIRQVESVTRFPLLLDSMQIAPGVTARERDVVKRGPKIDSSRGDVPSDLVLRPVRAHNPHPTVNVSDLLDQHICVKPLAEPGLVPPIGRSPVATSH